MKLLTTSDEVVTNKTLALPHISSFPEVCATANSYSAAGVCPRTAGRQHCPGRVLYMKLGSRAFSTLAVALIKSPHLS